MYMGRFLLDYTYKDIRNHNHRFEGMIAQEALTVIDHNSNLGRAQVCAK